jgi:hypothetical protein
LSREKAKPDCTILQEVIMLAENVNCHKCKYYYITWEAKMPYGCKAFGFKSKQIPSTVVYQSSGKACQGFDEKNSKSQG